MPRSPGRTFSPRPAVAGQPSPTAPAAQAPVRRDPLDAEPASEDALPRNRYFERELSWLAFNERVLELAEDTSIPLLERVRFLSIFASNLDEFFMVRVAGLQRRIATKMAVATAAGFEPSDVMTAIRKTAHELVERHSKLFSEAIRPDLAEAGIHIVTWGELAGFEQDALSSYFRGRVYPILTPMAVDPAHPFPYVSGLSLNLAVILHDEETGAEHFARIKVPGTLQRFVEVSSPGSSSGKSATHRSLRFLPIEDLIAMHLPSLFPGMEVQAHHTFRVTRNADLEVEEDDAENLLNALEKELLQRRFGPAVRLELTPDMSPELVGLLVDELGVDEEDTYQIDAPIDLGGLSEIADIEATNLHYPTFLPQTHRTLADVESASPTDMFSALRNGDILLHHPYDSFATSVQEFIHQAARDKHVVAIKQTLYRTSGNSPIVDALIDAAERGKEVLALVEIKARFDEAANISWARTLERHGVHVVYGMVGLKTHAKLCLVVRSEPSGLQRYCHIGTGNYHPKTARLYEDSGLLTSDAEVVEDVARLFNQLSGFAPRPTFRRLLVAPGTLRQGLVEHIDTEICNHRDGRPAWIRLKINSLVDEAIIDELYRASRAGVPVDVVVRGSCALRPGVPGLSETIRVRSILGRFLEHSRIFAFCNNGDPAVYLGSADLMHRNLDRRVEAAVRLADPAHVAEQVSLLEQAASDATASWHLGTDGHWVRHHVSDDGEPLVDHQAAIVATKQRRSSRRR